MTTMISSAEAQKPVSEDIKELIDNTIEGLSKDKVDNDCSVYESVTRMKDIMSELVFRTVPVQIKAKSGHVVKFNHADPASMKYLVTKLSLKFKVHAKLSDELEISANRNEIFATYSVRSWSNPDVVDYARICITDWHNTRSLPGDISLKALGSNSTYLERYVMQRYWQTPLFNSINDLDHIDTTIAKEDVSLQSNKGKNASMHNKPIAQAHLKKQAILKNINFDSKDFLMDLKEPIEKTLYREIYRDYISHFSDIAKKANQPFDKPERDGYFMELKDKHEKAYPLQK